MGPGSQVRVWVPEYGSHTRDLFRSRFPSTGPILGIYLGPGSQVRVQVLEYGFKFLSMEMGWPNIGDSYGMV